MKKYSYGRLIRMSWKRTVEILFRPFNIKKWIMLGIIVLLAGQVGGFNFNINGNKADFEKAITQITKGAPVPSVPAEQKDLSSSEGPSMPNIRILPIFGDPKKAVLLLIIIGSVLLLLGLLLFLWMWLQANFSFVFIESIVKNDASFRVPFIRINRRAILI